jgi:hypothetical protein
MSRLENGRFLEKGYKRHKYSLTQLVITSFIPAGSALGRCQPFLSSEVWQVPKALCGDRFLRNRLPKLC